MIKIINYKHKEKCSFYLRNAIAWLLLTVKSKCSCNYNCSGFTVSHKTLAVIQLQIYVSHYQWVRFQKYPSKMCCSVWLIFSSCNRLITTDGESVHLQVCWKCHYDESLMNLFDNLIFHSHQVNKTIPRTKYIVVNKLAISRYWQTFIFKHPCVARLISWTYLQIFYFIFIILVSKLNVWRCVYKLNCMP